MIEKGKVTIHLKSGASVPTTVEYDEELDDDEVIEAIASDLRESSKWIVLDGCVVDVSSISAVVLD